MACRDYDFVMNGERENLGFPARVFGRKLPEWTPDVREYSSDEYPQLDHALYCNVRGFLALSVFDNSGECCVGVIELVMTTRKNNFALEVREVGKALEDVDLKCPFIFDCPNMQGHYLLNRKKTLEIHQREGMRRLTNQSVLRLSSNALEGDLKMLPKALALADLH